MPKGWDRWLAPVAGVVLAAALVAALTYSSDDESSARDADPTGVVAGPEGAGPSAQPGDPTDVTAAPSGSDAPTAAGPSGSGRTGGSQSGGTAPSAGAAGPEKVVVAVIVPDTGALARVGLVSTTPEQNEHWWKTFLEIESKAGGPTLEPRFIRFEALDQEDRAAACQRAVDVKPAFVLGQSGFNGPPVLCLTEQFGIPTILIEGESQEFFRRAKGLLFTKNSSIERTLRNTALLTHRRNALKDRDIGIVSSDQPGDVAGAKEALKPQLEQLGYKVVRHSIISSDLGTASSQIPVEVAQMRSAGAEAIFFVMNPVPITLWVQESDGQGYRPRYVIGDTLGATTDFTLQNLPESFDGWGVTVTQQGFDLLGEEPAPDKACREKYEQHTGGELPPPGEAGYRNATVYCGLVGLLGRAVRNGGATSPAGFISAFEAFGEVALPDLGGASFGPGKHDGADMVRLLRADMDQRRWVPNGAFERGV